MRSYGAEFSICWVSCAVDAKLNTGWMPDARSNSGPICWKTSVKLAAAATLTSGFAALLDAGVWRQAPQQSSANTASAYAEMNRVGVITGIHNGVAITRPRRPYKTISRCSGRSHRLDAFSRGELETRCSKVSWRNHEQGSRSDSRSRGCYRSLVDPSRCYESRTQGRCDR